jgi:predicted CopG family antitoxin
MAVKTITIDMEAYERLSRLKRDGESFSETIKRVTPKRVDHEAWLASLASDPFSDDFVQAVEQQVAQRRAPQNIRPAHQPNKRLRKSVGKRKPG